MLQQLLGQEVFAFLILFIRVGAIFMLAPALGERSMPVAVRLSAALVISFAMLPSVGDRLPQAPQSMLALGGLMVHELIIGLTLAVIAQFIQAALHTAGTVVSFMAGLAFAQQFDPFQGTQSAVVSSFFTITGVALIFITDLHLLLLEAIFDSYLVFPPNEPLIPGDLAQLATDTIGQSFALGVRLASPFILAGLILYAALGLIARLIPQLQVFFLALPLNILQGLVILAIVLPGIMMVFLTTFEETVGQFVR